MFEFFYDYDYFCAEGMNGFLKSAGGFFTPLFRGITFLGEIGWAFILASLVMLLFRRTRRAGVMALGAIVLGALFSNIILKNAVARPRPFHNEASPFYAFWQEAGSLEVGEYSFPSGHATASTAFAVALVFAFDKRFSWTALFLPLVMGITRVYFQVHFASDVLFGYLVGALCGVGAWLIVKLFLKYFGEKKWVKRLFDEWSVVIWVQSLLKKRAPEAQGAESAEVTEVTETTEVTESNAEPTIEPQAMQEENAGFSVDAEQNGESQAK